MLDFAELLVWALLVLAISGGAFLIGALLCLSLKEPKNLAGQGYGTRVEVPQSASARNSATLSIDDRQRRRGTAAPPDGYGGRRAV